VEPKITPDTSESSPSNEERSSLQPTDRWARLSRVVALYSALGAGALFAGIKITEVNVRAETRETFGTRAAPRFSVGEISLNDEVRPLTDLLKEPHGAGQSVPFNAVVAETAVADFEEMLALLERKLGDFAPDREAFEGWRRRFSSSDEGAVLLQLEFNEKFPEFGALCEALRGLGESADLNAFNLNFEALSLDVEQGRRFEQLALWERFENIYPSGQGTSTEYAQRIFEQVTGRPLPRSVTIERTDIAEPGVAGTSRMFDQVITVEPMSFAQEVSTLCHEMGHLIARPGEEFCDGEGVFSFSLNASRSRETAVLEEASAYAFERVCIGAIPDESIRLRAARGFENQALFQAKLFFKGEREIHCEAGVVAEAACRVFGDAREAYRYLSTTAEVSSLIRSAVEEARKEWGDTPSGRCVKAAESLRALSARVHALRERFDPDNAR